MPPTTLPLLRSAIAAHHTATDDGAWDGPANEARLADDAGAATLRKAFAWMDPSKDPGAKAAYKFIHHDVDGSGDVGAANLKACSSGIGVLNGGRGGTTIPDADQAGVHRHLAAHMTDGGMEPPDLMRSMPGALERRFLPIEELRIATDAAGAPTINWTAAVFDSLSQDLGGFRERIYRRAFSKTLQEADVRALFNHDRNFVMGRNKAGTLDMRVDLRGLQCSVTPPDTAWARDLMTSINRGDITGGSFGFQVVNDRWDAELSDDGLPIRELREIALRDVSIVTYPAYLATEGASVRSLLTGDEVSLISLLGVDLEQVIRPLLRARAGTPLAPEERSGYLEMVDRLRLSIPEPPTPEPQAPMQEDRDAEHLIAVELELRRMQLDLLRVRGRAS